MADDTRSMAKKFGLLGPVDTRRARFMSPVADARLWPMLCTQAEAVDVPGDHGDIWVDSDGRQGLLWRVSVDADGVAWTWCTDG